MKRTVLIFIYMLAASATSLYSQENQNGSNPKSERIVFSYDHSGNRTSREIEEIILKADDIKDTENGEGNEEMTEEDNSEKTFEEELSMGKVSIFPNPTKGKLQLTVENLDAQQQNFYELRNLSGSLVLKKDLRTAQSVIDISQTPKGTYLLMICIGKEAATWKIIKE